ncbi:response regulator [Trinickia caryophylli]|uniref:Response regulator receiver domain-containing protein n=1 Tax=Trinickia caryophylli TaxID=28094 RepID=A0A1X7FKI0_TRICW|nr:response regulator [Trinickia caryophylli]PMS13147.1 response regulator [Trinickia caryophylli]TRX19326.1 response regulator [Trinickia caryophylli]WQE13372.1 response regulator [Trinickia caryophylli]SMF53781.1 Response regulator receiver domain-containing protein [Trinickia caryophylli]GLU34111.1 hypothetical protein Busp01_39530 [Trinickia caryophylli]
MKSHWPGVGRNETATANPTEPPEARAVGASTVPQRKRVLVVDRDGDARAGLANLLESMGYDALVASDAKQALEMAGRLTPDAALVDIGAPQLEGLAVARALRERLGTHALLLIAMTGWGQPQYRDMALAAGYDVHWVKPVSADQLNFLLSMTLV